MLKIIISFFSGATLCGVLFFGIQFILPSQAAEGDGDTDNISTSLVELLPDIEGIYEQSLHMPFIKAESKIYDEDIAEYYHDLMEATGLGGG